MSTRAGSVVKRRRKPGMMAMQRTDAQHTVQQGEHHAMGGGPVGVFVVACAEVERDLGIDADAKADGHWH